MEEMLIKMADGGLVNYSDDSDYHPGCETCDHGSEYINEIDITLTRYKIHVRTNQSYECVLSEGQMMRLFLSEYDTIQTMTETEFTGWFEKRFREIVRDEAWDADCIEEFEVLEIKEGADNA